MMSLPTKFPKQILDYIAKGGIGALAVVALWAWQSWRGENRLDYQYQLERAETREAAYLETIENQSREITALQKGFYFLSASRRESPLPEWAKVLTGHYQWKNDAFDKWVAMPAGVNPDSILFRTDLEIWEDKDLADSYRQNDLKVIQQNRVIHSVEYARIGGEIIAWHSWKYPIHDATNQVIGVGGVAVREDAINEINH
ncbi:PAS domain-containing protein [Lewinella sp. W8]|uniref:PAS domain-containing protein n=1 Tax=Lewinella sp. W8 TaxID=2528208 RepID=UPI001067337C|nr:PAS domain-containing protein [Lewinella sp. W8]MTB53932.1 hypothetical protein [Lewinella sp. W8]